MMCFNKVNSINSETAVRLLIYEIRERNPDAVKFAPKTQDIRTILLLLSTKRYSSIMYLYGRQFLFEVLKLYEEFENFEQCQEILSQVRTHDELFDDDVLSKMKRSIDD